MIEMVEQPKVEPFYKELNKTYVKLGDREFHFKDPDTWTLGEVCDIEEAAVDWSGLIPKPSNRLKMVKTLAYAVEELDESAAIELEYYYAINLYNLVRWQSVPLGNSLTLNLKQEEDQSTNDGSVEPGAS